MTLAVAKNCKMMKQPDIDDVINKSKVSDMPQNFLKDSNISRSLYIPSFKSIQSVYLTHLPWQICLRKTPPELWGGCTPPLWGSTETTFHLSEN